MFACVHVLLQDQQQLLSAYQSLVVKQLVSQSQSRKQEEAEGEADKAEEQDEEASSVRTQLMALTPQVKDLVLSQKKTAFTEDWTFERLEKWMSELIYNESLYGLTCLDEYF